MDVIYVGITNSHYKTGNVYTANRVSCATVRVKADKEYPTSDGWGWFTDKDFNNKFKPADISLENE